MMPKTHQPRPNRLMKNTKQPGVSDRDKQKELHRAPVGQDFDPRQYQYPGLTEKDVLDLKEVFDSFDLNGDGFIAPLELRAALLK